MLTDRNLLVHKLVFTIHIFLSAPLHHFMCHQSISVISHNNGQAEHKSCHCEILNIEQKSAYTAEQSPLTAQGESLAYLSAISFQMN